MKETFIPVLFLELLLTELKIPLLLNVCLELVVWPNKCEHFCFLLSFFFVGMSLECVHTLRLWLRYFLIRKLVCNVVFYIEGLMNKIRERQIVFMLIYRGTMQFAQSLH